MNCASLALQKSIKYGKKTIPTETKMDVKKTDFRKCFLHS